ncbi:MAG: IS3 family transposase, partial [Phycisphaerales bacterium]|nr:IS3 family transposase [Phycisphaerales bacterium]
MIYTLIRHHLAGDYPVKVCCNVLGVSTSGYYHARSRGPSRRDCRHALLAEHVRVTHEANRRVYGSPRIARDLRSKGVRICRNTAAKLMKELGIRSRRCRRFRPRTTDSSATVQPAPNLLNRVFKTASPDSVWLADITYIPLESGFAYLAVILDLHSRAVVGWALDDSMTAALPARALHNAVVTRRPRPGLVHHSDRGVQYDSLLYRGLLQRRGFVQSMSRKGDCYDNAPMESFFATLKAELVGDTRYHDTAAARDDLFGYIDGFYNTRRIHSSIGYAAPHHALNAKI